MKQQSLEETGTVDISELFRQKQAIFKKRSTLEEDFIPDVLPFREKEIKWIADNLYPAVDGDKPPHMLLLGQSGTGKTATVLRVLTELQNIVKDVIVCHVTADGTQHQVLASILRKFGVNISRCYGLGNAISRLKDILDGRITIIVLDELDKMLHDGCDVLYHFSRWGNTCVIGISNNFNVRALIDDARVLSSFLTRNLIFERYDAVQLGRILTYRASLAFHEGALEEDVIPCCAAISTHRGGDARYALDILLYAGDIAVREGSQRVTTDHINRAVREHEDDTIRKGIVGLSDAHKCLLLAILKKGVARPSEILDVANRFLFEYTGRTYSPRHLRRYLADLELYDYIRVRQKGKGRGKGSEWTVTLNSYIDPQLIESALRDSLPDAF